MSMIRWSFSIVFLYFLPFLTEAQRLPDDAYMKGLAFYRMENADSSIYYFSSSLEENKKNEDALYYRGRSYLKKGENKEALQDFLACEELEKGKAAFEIAGIFASSGNLDDALVYLDINLNSNYKRSEKEVFMNENFLAWEEDSRWRKFWSNTNYYTGYDATITEANYLIKNEEFGNAVDLISEQIKNGSYRKAPLYAKRAEIYLAIEDYKTAVEDLNKAIDGDRRNAQLYKLRADALLEMGKYKTALEDYNSAVKYDSEEFEVYLNRAVAFSKNDMYDNAMKDIAFYRKYFPESVHASYIAGNINQEHKKYLDALKDYNFCLKKDPTKPEYFMGRGKTYMATQTYKYAQNDFSMALDLDPYNSEAYFLKGQTSLKLNDKEDACFCFKKAYSYGYGDALNYINDYCK